MKWDMRYLKLAQEVSTWSKDPRKQVGAVITDDKYIRGVGFNGFPEGIADTSERLNNQELKLLLMVHAEVNAILAAQGKGDTIYVFPCLPCTSCLGQIIQAGIKRIVSLDPVALSKWYPNFVKELITEAKIELTLYSGSSPSAKLPDCYDLS